MSFPFQVPFIRWADFAVLRAGGSGPELRRLYDHELVYVVAGKGHIVIEGVSHEAQLDRLFLVQPRQWHSYRADAGENLTLLGVHFDWITQYDTLQFSLFFAADEDNAADESLFRAPQNISDWDLKTTPFLDLQTRPNVRRSLEEIVIEYSIGTEEARLRAGSLLAATLILMSREARTLSQNQELQRVGADAARRVERARKLLENVEANVSVEEVAREVGWSGDHLRRVFRAVLGTSPNALQSQARLRRARELLRGDESSIGEIARLCGLEDSESFARWFKAESGLTPRQFRAMSRQSEL